MPLCKCSSKLLTSLGWICFVLVRLFYLLFFLVACFAFDKLHELLGRITICSPSKPQNMSEGEYCTDMTPVITSCLVSSVLSFTAILLHTAIEIMLQARGPMRYLCGESREFGQGFLAMLRLCIVLVLLQTVVSFMGVWWIVTKIEAFKEVSLDDNYAVISAAGILATLACVLTVVDIAVRFVAHRCGPADRGALTAPLSPDGPLAPPSAPRWRVRGLGARPQTVSPSTADWRCAYTGE